jgi:hypothetical protein
MSESNMDLNVALPAGSSESCLVCTGTQAGGLRPGWPLPAAPGPGAASLPAARFNLKLTVTGAGKITLSRGESAAMPASVGLVLLDLKANASTVPCTHTA